MGKMTKMRWFGLTDSRMDAYATCRSDSAADGVHLDRGNGSNAPREPRPRTCSKDACVSRLPSLVSRSP